MDWTKFDKILIERMQVMLKAGCRNRGIDPTDLKTALDYFYNAMIQQIQPTAEIVDANGPGVMRVRIALTDIMPTSVTCSVLGTVIPYPW